MVHFRFRRSNNSKKCSFSNNSKYQRKAKARLRSFFWKATHLLLTLPPWERLPLHLPLCLPWCPHPRSRRAPLCIPPSRHYPLLLLHLFISKRLVVLSLLKLPSPSFPMVASVSLCLLYSSRNLAEMVATESKAPLLKVISAGYLRANNLLLRRV